QAGSRRRAEELRRTGGCDAAEFAYKPPAGNALELLEWVKTTDTDLPVIILTGHATVDLAVEAMQQGAEQFLTKPVDLAAFEVILSRTLENRRNRRQQQFQRSRRSAEGLNPFVGSSAGIRELAGIAEKLAMSSSPIQIRGETGTGKGVLARWIHDHGPRSQEAFVDINCAGLSPELLDSELFGHQRGAFTGATSSKVGLFEVGHRGSVFLDEIGDVDLRVQPKLLKVIEEKRFRRLGEVREREVSIRLIAASHQDLRKLARAGRFREDLYFRISTLPLEIPPLRARREDIRPLAEDILERLTTELGRPAVSLSGDAAKAIQRYAWPGNIRELRNVLERALLLSNSEELSSRDLLFEVSPPAAAAGDEADLTLQEVERRHIERVLQRTNSAVSAAARILGISRTTLYQKIKSLGIDLSRS
ncbi:MAG: sigma-54-dependent Fis family transcriptional regulator, partial [bacterium]|nr:sigma-54-dependent Fis family transcriptional regulator [bacterium]